MTRSAVLPLRPGARLTCLGCDRPSRIGLGTDRPSPEHVWNLTASALQSTTVRTRTNGRGPEIDNTVAKGLPIMVEHTGAKARMSPGSRPRCQSLRQKLPGREHIDVLAGRETDVAEMHDDTPLNQPVLHT